MIRRSPPGSISFNLLKAGRRIYILCIYIYMYIYIYVYNIYIYMRQWTRLSENGHCWFIVNWTLRDKLRCEIWINLRRFYLRNCKWMPLVKWRSLCLGFSVSHWPISRLVWVGWASLINSLRPRQMDAISQTTSSSAFSWMKMFEFRLKFQWSDLRVQLTLFQHWFR